MSGRRETWSACFAGDDSQNFLSLVRQLEVAPSDDDDRAEQVRILTTRFNKSATRQPSWDNQQSQQLTLGSILLFFAIFYCVHTDIFTDVVLNVGLDKKCHVYHNLTITQLPCSSGRMSTICICVHRQTPDVKRLDLPDISPISPKVFELSKSKLYNSWYRSNETCKAAFFDSTSNTFGRQAGIILWWINEPRELVIVKVLPCHTVLGIYSKASGSLSVFSSLFGALKLLWTRPAITW